MITVCAQYEKDGRLVPAAEAYARIIEQKPQTRLVLAGRLAQLYADQGLPAHCLWGITIFGSFLGRRRRRFQGISI